MIRPDVPAACDDSANIFRVQTEELITMILHGEYIDKGHGISCARYVARGNVMGMHLDVLAILGPWRMHSGSST